MRARSIAARLVLITAALTTVATSAPEDILLSTTIDATLSPGRTRISIIASRAAVNHADFVRIDIAPAMANDSLQIEEPDPALPITLTGSHTVELRFESIDALCVHDRDCDAMLTVENSSEGPLDVSVTATFVRLGDGQFFFPDNPPFPDDATVEVVVGP